MQKLGRDNIQSFAGKLCTLKYDVTLVLFFVSIECAYHILSLIPLPGITVWEGVLLLETSVFTLLGLLEWLGAVEA